MYVCLCHGFTDGDVRAALDGGCRSVAAVYRTLADRPQCGKCVPDVRGMVNEHRARCGGASASGGCHGLAAPAVAQSEVTA
ncbi:bacterioferritin-associated ferredoxin [Ferrovibrio sp.]|uniref:(2Fe-2S)-binding protein n=1 Tax=Ferrovibrio sp. TaxID=1917215 RepID=UPI00351642EF